MTGPGTSHSDRTYGASTETSGNEVRGKAEHLSERAREAASGLKQQAEEAAHGVRDRARSMVDRQKHAAAGKVEGVAHALRTASDELRDQGQPMIADYSQYAAEGLESMARSLDRRDVDDFVEGVEQFARERPVAFLGGAVVAGFALARFMKSSAARRYRRADRGGEAPPATVGMAANPAGATTTPGAWAPDAGTPGAGG